MINMNIDVQSEGFEPILQSRTSHDTAILPTAPAFSEPSRVYPTHEEEDYNPYKAKIETLQFACLSLLFMMAAIITVWFNA